MTGSRFPDDPTTPPPLRPALAAARDDDIDIEWDGTVTGQVKAAKRQAPGNFTFVRAPGGVPEAEIYVRPQVIAEAMAHAKELPDREVGGLLVGELCEDPELASGQFARVLKTVRFKTVGSSAHLKIEGGVLQAARDEARREGLIDVGWYHSHPNWGIFLSETDHTQFQDSHFNKPWHVALVVDPRRNEHGFFMRRRGGDGRAERADFFYLWEEGEDRSFPTAGPPDTGPAAEEPGEEQAARLKRLANNRAALDPDNKDLGLKPVTLKTALVKFKGDDEAHQLSPQPCFTSFRKPRSSDRSRPAVSVVIAESDLADKEAKLIGLEREMGFLLGRFGRQGREDFVIVKGFANIKGSEAADAYAKMLDSTGEIARAAADVNRKLANSSNEREREMRVVGWYYRSPGPSDAIPEDHMPVISDVFSDPRFVTLAFFAGAGGNGKPGEDCRFRHQVFVTQGEFQWRGPAPVTSLDLLSTDRAKMGAAAEEAERGGVQMAFVDEPKPRNISPPGAFPPGATPSGQSMYRANHDAQPFHLRSDGLKGFVVGVIVCLLLAAVLLLVSGEKAKGRPVTPPAVPAEQAPASEQPKASPGEKAKAQQPSGLGKGVAAPASPLGAPGAGGASLGGGAATGPGPPGAMESSDSRDRR